MNLVTILAKEFFPHLYQPIAEKLVIELLEIKKKQLKDGE